MDAPDGASAYKGAADEVKERGCLGLEKLEAVPTEIHEALVILKQGKNPAGELQYQRGPLFQRVTGEESGKTAEEEADVDCKVAGRAVGAGVPVAGLDAAAAG